MKKLLVTLSALGITASSAATVISCGSTDKDPVNDTIISSIAAELEEKTTASYLSVDVPNNEQSQDQVKDKIVSQSVNLSKYKKQLTIKVANFSAASEDGDKGKIALEVLHKQENIKNPQDGSNEFVFNFLTRDILEDMKETIPGLTNQVTDLLNNNPSVNLADFKVDLGDAPVVGGKQTIKNLINTVIPTIKAFLPAKIPANFTDDENWAKFQGLIATAETLLKDNNTINESITPMEGISLNVSLKITDVLTSILPDLIHLSNFIEQQTKTGNTNLILNLIQYFFAKPSDINDDGFGQINQGIKDVNNEGQTITFTNNLERLVYDLFEGWQTSTGSKVPNITPIKLDYNGQPIRYQSNLTDQNNIAVGVFDFIPEVNLSNFIDFILGTNHSWDDNQDEQKTWEGGYDLQNPLSFFFTLGGKILGFDDPIHFQIPTNNLADAIKDSLKTFLNSNPDLENKLDYLNLNWTQGEMTVWYQTDGNWLQAKTFADLLTAKDLRIQFINNTWEIKNKLNNQVETINDKYLILNLDVTTSTSHNSDSE